MNKEMTIQQIFDIAFKQAKDGGWIPEETRILALEFNGAQVPIEGVLFNRGFMIGLFGEEMINEKGNKIDQKNKDKNHIWQPAWKYYAKSMAISEDPIQYLIDYLI